jgi:hypothetical protein
MNFPFPKKSTLHQLSPCFLFHCTDPHEPLKALFIFSALKVRRGTNLTRAPARCFGMSPSRQPCSPARCWVRLLVTTHIALSKSNADWLRLLWIFLPFKFNILIITLKTILSSSAPFYSNTDYLARRRERSRHGDGLTQLWIAPNRLAWRRTVWFICFMVTVLMRMVNFKKWKSTSVEIC